MREDRKNQLDFEHDHRVPQMFKKVNLNGICQHSIALLTLKARYRVYLLQVLPTLSPPHLSFNAGCGTAAFSTVVIHVDYTCLLLNVEVVLIFVLAFGGFISKLWAYC